MRKAGYVHQDISARNCFWDGVHGKISDLEYAKPYDGMLQYNTVTAMTFSLSVG
jgi:hypothetical protein